MTSYFSTTESLQTLLLKLFPGSTIETTFDGFSFADGTSKVLATIHIPIPHDGEPSSDFASLTIRVPNGSQHLDAYLKNLGTALRNSMGFMLRKSDMAKLDETATDSTSETPKSSDGSMSYNDSELVITGSTLELPANSLTPQMIQDFLKGFAELLSKQTQKLEALEDLVSDLTRKVFLR